MQLSVQLVLLLRTSALSTDANKNAARSEMRQKFDRVFDEEEKWCRVCMDLCTEPLTVLSIIQPLSMRRPGSLLYRNASQYFIGRGQSIHPYLKKANKSMHG